MINKQSPYQLAIKNMVCPRCITAVKKLLIDHNNDVVEVGLGYAILANQPDLLLLKNSLTSLGFELLDEQDKILIDRVKTKIIALLQSEQPILKENLSYWLATFFDTDFHQLSALFSHTEGITIEKFFILQRIEKAKELLVYNQLSLKEIAFKLGFSSTAHLSAQFKKETGFTTSHFKEVGFSKRKSLDSLK